MKHLKWQILSESSMTQSMLWIILIKLFDGMFIVILGSLFITGNIFTMLKGTSQLPRDYFKKDRDYFKEEKDLI